MAKRVQYKGIAFPFKKNAQAFPASAVDDDLIKQSLVQIILTARGERVMRPDFGCNALAFIFEPNDDLLVQFIRTEVGTSIAKFEPRVVVHSIDVSRDEEEVTITINYIVLSTRETDKVSVTVGSP